MIRVNYWRLLEKEPDAAAGGAAEAAKGGAHGGKTFGQEDLDAPEPTADDRGDNFVPTEEDTELQRIEDEATAAATAAPAKKDPAAKKEAVVEATKAEGEDPTKAEGADPTKAEGTDPTKAEGADATKAEPKGKFIPKSRYDSLRARYDALRRTTGQPGAEAAPAAAATARAAPAATTAVATQPKTVEEALTRVTARFGEIDTRMDAIADEIEKANSDGDKSKVALLRTERNSLRSEERQLSAHSSELRAQQIARSTTDSQFGQREYDAAVTAIEEEFPELNPDDETNYNDDLAEDIRFDAEAYEAKGMRQADALMRAVEKNTRASGLKPKSERNVAAAAEKKEPARDVKVNVDKNLKAAAKVAPDLKHVGGNSDKAGMKDKLDPTKLTDEEIEALPISKQRELRGDFAE